MTNKYQRQVPGTTIDVYDVLTAWDVRNPGIQHAIKKLLQPGQRGHKDMTQDLEEAIASIRRGIEIIAAEERADPAPQEPALPSKAWDAAGWIEWSGGENPVGGKKVQYRLRDGYTDMRPAHEISWKRAERSYDIVAYKIIEEAPAELELPEGFKPCAGGAQPEETKLEKVSIRFRNGYISGAVLADLFRWSHLGQEGDIVGYRVL